MTVFIYFGKIIVLIMLHSNGNTLFKLKSEKQLYVIFLIVSILFGSIIYYSLSKNILPYQFETIEKTIRASSDEFVFLRDFQNNGSIYKFRLINNPTQKYFKIDIIKPDGKYIDQHNFKGKVTPHYVHFHDWNQDGIEELFVYSTKLDTVFLTIINIINKTKYINEQVIICGSKTERKNWDISYVATDLMDVNNDKKLDLVFGLRSGLAKYPRGVFTFDIYKKEIINQRLFNAGFFDLNLFDLDNDGENEIVVSNAAVGNISETDKLNDLFDYSDFYSWLFVLDKNLNFKFPAQKFNTYPSGLYVKFHKENINNYLLIYGTQPNQNPGIFELNSKLEEVKHIPISSLKFVNQIGENDNYLVAISYDGSSFVLNKKLDIVKKLTSNYLKTYLGPISLNGHQKVYVFNTIDQKIKVFDTDFQKLAEFNPNDKLLIYEFFTKRNPYINNGNELNFHTKDHFYQIKLVESNLYSFIPYFLILSSISFFFIFVYTNKLSQMIFRRFKAYGFFINQNNKAVLIINQDGKIKSYNKFFIEFVNNAAFLKKNENYGAFLTNNLELKKFIDNSIKSKREHIKELAITTHNSRKSIITTVYPIISFWGFPHAFIIEFDDITNPIMDERQKIWVQTSQKIAHDIKTPLSTIQLNLKALNQRVEEEKLKNKEDFKDDLNMISSEVGRIRELTKSFLQFASLEKPNLQSCNLIDIIENSLLQFRTHFNNGVELETSFEKVDAIINADSSQLEKLFHIIIENSIDAIKGKGQIEIKTSTSENSHNNKSIIIEISDNGCGILEKDNSKLFEPYYTTKKDGTGMGLAIAKKIVEDNNGYIKVYSKKGMGTTVTLSFALVGE